MDTKFFLTSKVVIGLIGFALNRFFKLEVDNQLISDVITYGIDAVSGALVLWGRIDATKKLTFLP